MALDTPAVADGEMERDSFARFLVHAIDQRLTGALFLTEPSGVQHVIRFTRGAPVKVRPGDRYALLGEMLVEAGVVNEATLRDALATKGLLGDVLLLAGCVRSDVIERLAEQQFIRRMVRMFRLSPETLFQFCEGHSALLDYGGEPANVDPLALVWAGLREHGADVEAMEQSLELLRGGPMRIHARATTARLGLTGPEALLIDHIRAGGSSMTVSEAFGLQLVSDEVLERLLHALVVTRQLEVNAGDPARTSTAPVGAAESEAMQQATQRKALAFARMNLRSTEYRIGAAAPDAPGDGERGTSIVRSLRDSRAEPSTEAPVPRAAPSAPVSASAPVEANVPPPVSETPISAPAASDVRISAAGTRAGEAAPSRPPDANSARPSPDVVLSGSALFQLATARMLGGDLAGALRACARASAIDPENPEYVALSVWTRSQMDGANLFTLALELDHLLRAHEDHVPARYYRGVIRKRRFDDEGALADFRRVLELSPTHEDAAMELDVMLRRQRMQRLAIFTRLFRR